MALYEYLRSNIHINEPTLRENFIEGLFRGLLKDPVGFLNSMPEEDEIPVRRCLNDLCFEAVANPALASIGKQVKAAFRSLPPRRWRSLTETLSVTFRLPDGSVELGPSTGHTLTLHLMTRQVVWTRPRRESYHYGESGCIGCSSCTIHKRPPRGTKTEVFHINHFYNHVVDHYVSVSYDKYGKYGTDSLEEISKCFYVEGGASLFEVLGYPSAAPSAAQKEPAPSVVPESVPSESIPSAVPSESIPSHPGRFLSGPEVELEALLQQAQTLFEEALLAEDRLYAADKALATVNATKEDVKRAVDVASAKRAALPPDIWEQAVMSSQAALAKVEAEARGTAWRANEARKCRVLAWYDVASIGIKITNTAIMLRNRP